LEEELFEEATDGCHLWLEWFPQVKLCGSLCLNNLCSANIVFHILVLSTVSLFITHDIFPLFWVVTILLLNFLFKVFPFDKSGSTLLSMWLIRRI